MARPDGLDSVLSTSGHPPSSAESTRDWDSHVASRAGSFQAVRGHGACVPLDTQPADPWYYPDTQIMYGSPAFDATLENPPLWCSEEGNWLSASRDQSAYAGFATNSDTNVQMLSPPAWDLGHRVSQLCPQSSPASLSPLGSPLVTEYSLDSQESSWPPESGPEPDNLVPLGTSPISENFWLPPAELLHSHQAQVADRACSLRSSVKEALHDDLEHTARYHHRSIGSHHFGSPHDQAATVPSDLLTRADRVQSSACPIVGDPGMGYKTSGFALSRYENLTSPTTMSDLFW